MLSTRLVGDHTGVVPAVRRSEAVDEESLVQQVHVGPGGGLQTLTLQQ